MGGCLQLYPSLASILCLWSCCMALQVALTWGRCNRQPHQYAPSRNPVATQIKKKHHRWTDEWLLQANMWRRRAFATIWWQAERKSSEQVIIFTEMFFPTARVFHQSQPSKTGFCSFTWKQMAFRSVILTFLVIFVRIATNTVVLYMRTGALAEMPYEWYSMKATGERLFNNSIALPSEIMSTCRSRHGETKISKIMLTVDDVIDKYESADVTESTIVYVVPFNADKVIELKLDHVQSTTSNLHSPSRLRSSDWPLVNMGSGDNVLAYEKATPIDNLTLFPYLWHSILGPHFDPRVEQPSPWTRAVPQLNLEYRLVGSKLELSTLPQGSNILAVVQWMPSVHQLFFEGTGLPNNAKVGFLALAREDCNNAQPQEYIDNKQLKFGLFPYGDCSLVDGDRFSVLPLGPSFEHGFPINTHRIAAPTATARKYLLNLMVSWTIEKPTRIQAMMAALEVCTDTNSCIIEHNDLMFKALQKVDQAVGTNLRWYFSSAPDDYIDNLKESKFTLCPHGKNPEQYRIWEALAAGSIPIIEEFPQQSLPGTFYHPSYPLTWKCMPEDIHGILKQFDAPVLFVSDWKRDLPRIIDKYVDNPEELVDLQQRAKIWYLRLGEHVQADLIEKSMRHFVSGSTYER